MKSIKSVNKVVIIIGVLSIVFGIYSIIQGKPFGEYFFSIFIGITLIGAGWYNNKALEKTEH